MIHFAAFRRPRLLGAGLLFILTALLPVPCAFSQTIGGSNPNPSGGATGNTTGGDGGNAGDDTGGGDSPEPATTALIVASSALAVAMLVRWRRGRSAVSVDR